MREILRKTAIFTLKPSYNHVVQTVKARDHALVIHMVFIASDADILATWDGFIGTLELRYNFRRFVIEIAFFHFHRILTHY